MGRAQQERRKLYVDGIERQRSRNLVHHKAAFLLKGTAAQPHLQSCVGIEERVDAQCQRRECDMIIVESAFLRTLKVVVIGEGSFTPVERAHLILVLGKVDKYGGNVRTSESDSHLQRVARHVHRDVGMVGMQPLEGYAPYGFALRGVFGDSVAKAHVNVGTRKTQRAERNIRIGKPYSTGTEAQAPHPTANTGGRYELCRIDLGVQQFHALHVNPLIEERHKLNASHKKAGIGNGVGHALERVVRLCGKEAVHTKVERET